MTWPYLLGYLVGTAILGYALIQVGFWLQDGLKWLLRRFDR